MQKSGRAMTKTYLYYSLGISVALALIILGVRNYLPPQVPLFYGKAVGEEQLVSTIGLMLAPLTSFIVTVINFLLIRVIKDNFLQKVLTVSTLFISGLIAITTLKIIVLVGFF